MISGGPKIETDGLILAYSANSYKSYKGEPTTNLANNSNGTINWSAGTASATCVRTTISTSDYHYRLTITGTGYIRMYFDSSILIDGTTYTVSYKYKRISGSSTFIPNDWCDTGVPITNKEFYLGDGWFYRIVTGTRSTYTSTYRFLDVTTSDGVFDIKEVQLESKSYSTPFTTYNRSTTNILLDLSENGNHGTAVNGAATKVTHYQYGQTITPKSAAYIEFDGANDYVSVPSISMGNIVTVCVWFKLNGLGSEQALFGPSANANDNWISVNSSNKIKLFATEYAEVGNFNITGDTVISTSNWYYATAVINENSAYLYLNGELENSSTKAYSIGSWTGTSNIGMRGNWSHYPLNGKVAMVNIYNKALSATEIRKQYLKTKSKFL